tara:strand:- start:3121 stop:4989 length:1869 start_codon:yes stop_codon:yes gene_type:complete
MREYLGLSSKSSTADDSIELSSEELEKQRVQKYKESKATQLIVCAWIIEICAAGIGFFFAYTTGEATRKYLNQAEDMFIGDPNVSVTLAMLPFMIIGVVELTKIPLAFAAYNAKGGFWKSLFVGVLLSLCLITGETIFTGMERSLDNQLKYFEGDKKMQEELRVDVSNLEKRALELEAERPIDDIDREYDDEIGNFEDSHYIEVDEINSERESRLSGLENQKAQSRELFINGSSQDEVGNLQTQLDGLLARMQSIEVSRDNEVRNLRETAQKEIDSKESQINSLTDSIKGMTQELDGGGLFSSNADEKEQLEAERVARSKAEIELEAVKSKRDQDIENYRNEINIKIEELDNERSEIQAKLTQARLKSEEAFNKEQDEINIEINALNERFDTRLGNILSRYEEEKSLREQNYLEARDRAVRVQTDLDQTRAEIKSKREEIIDVEQTINSKAGEIQVMRFAATYAAFTSDGERQGVENVTPEDIGIVMLFWFGSIALIAATTGTVIAFASFYIRDQKNWEYSWTDRLEVDTPWKEFLESRRQKNKAKKDYYIKKANGEIEPGIIRSISNALVRFTDSLVKRLTKPKIVKEEVIKYKYIPVDGSGKPLGLDNRGRATQSDNNDE